MITNVKNPTKSCHFCTQNIRVVDGKDIDTLRRFTSMQAKISTRRRTGLCAKHQRKVARAIKRARHMALLPFIPVH